ncbi:MAG: hypothetical protein MUC50_08175 [Myxococcota bacterium]|nr:hypothetical protein [Myxococcota bacterium]
MTYYVADECVAPLEADTTSDEDGLTGIGQPCAVDGTDCDDFEASYCLKHPLNQGDYCTLVDCASSAECTDGFTCCDCTGQTTLKPAIVGCLKDADADLAKAFCDCEL